MLFIFVHSYLIHFILVIYLSVTICFLYKYSSMKIFWSCILVTWLFLTNILTVCDRCCSVFPHYLLIMFFCSDGETFISADDLRINLWNLEISNQSFNIVDVKPTNMEDLTGKWFWSHCCHTSHWQLFRLMVGMHHIHVFMFSKIFGNKISAVLTFHLSFYEYLVRFGLFYGQFSQCIWC